MKLTFEQEKLIKAWEIETGLKFGRINEVISGRITFSEAMNWNNECLVYFANEIKRIYNYKAKNLEKENCWRENNEN